MDAQRFPVKLSLCVLFCMLGFLGNWFNLELSFNVDFPLGSFFVMLAILTTGGVYGAITGLVAGTCTYFLWNHPWSIVICAGEAIFVAKLYSKRKGNLVIYDIAYWVFIGMPLVYIFFHYIMGMQNQSTLLLMLKQSLNGVFNAVAAMLAYILFKIRKSRPGERTAYSRLLFVVMVSLVLLPTLPIFVHAMRTFQDRATKSLEAKVTYVSRTTRTSLANWIGEHHKSIQTLAVLVGDPETNTFEDMQHYVETLKVASPAFKKMGVLNKDSVTVAYFPMEEDGKSTLGVDFSDRPYISLMKNEKKPLIPDVVVGKLGNLSPIVLLLAPIVVSGEYKGYCTGVVQTSLLADLLSGCAESNINITVTDGEGKVIASTIAGLKVMDRFPRAYAGTGKHSSQEILRWMPAAVPNTSIMQRWEGALLVKTEPIGDTCDWKVIVEASCLPLIEDMRDLSIVRFTFVSLLILVSVTLSHFLSKGFVSTIVTLRELTGSLPQRLDEISQISWPKSGIEELGSLSDNFQEMASALMDDITRRKAAELALRASEGKFRSYMEAAPIAIFVADRHGSLVDFNPAAVELLGHDDASLKNMNIVDLHPEESRDQILDHFKTLLKIGHVETEILMKRRDGQLIWVSLHVVMIYNRYSLGYCLDITELKLAEKALRESEERFRTIFEQAAVGVALLDSRTGRYVRVNKKFCDIVGYSSEEMLALSFQDITHPDHVQSAVDRVTRLFAGSLGTFTVEKQYIHKNGSTVWAYLTVSPMRAEGLAPDFHIGIIEDITERKRLEDERARVEVQLRQAQKMESLGTLAGGIAHDFNNILGIITSYTEMAQWDAHDGQPVFNALQEVLKAATRAKDLVRQILAFSRQNEKERQSVEIGLIVKEALKMLRATLPSTIDVITNVSSKALVLADPTQIHQVLMNLCTNAAHAMQDSGGTLEVSLTDILLAQEDIPAISDLQPGPHVKLTVKDSGCGIDPAILERIFDPFFTTKETGVGTGLGLSVVHGIVKSHDGTIEVSSLRGAGTTFDVFIPCMDNTPATDEADSVQPSRGRERVLVVDDEPALAVAIKRMLERLGYLVDFRTNALEALDAFRNQPRDKRFELVITDMTMPHLTGIDLAKELLNLDPNLAILLCTGYSEKTDAKKVEGIGIQGFLMKPVVWKELARMVRKVLDEKIK
jgi:two-component system, cell cycle sensor histidine kinase and response regulator CckA